jgi:hypothetical protein
MNPFFERDLRISRRQFFGKAATGIGSVALLSMLAEDGFAQGKTQKTHHTPKAKRVIVLWQGGAPSQVDLFDYKPNLEKLRMQELPESVRQGKRLSTMTSGQGKFPILPAIKPFKQYGESGRWLSELLPHIGSISDEMCLVKSMHTDAVNHAPGVTFFLTGSQIPGRPSFGSWCAYGLGSMTDELPTFVVMTSNDEAKSCGQLFYDYYWGSGFIPSLYQVSASAPTAIPYSISQIPPACPANSAEECWTISPSSTANGSKTTAIPRSKPASPNTSSPSRCKLASPS